MMTTLDYIVLFGYLAGMLVVGALYTRVNKSSADMFAAGGRSPWWAAGLSSFMTMFSAGTFVVWGGLAYKYGLVAVTINLCYGVAALLAGYLVAGRWKQLNVRTPAEYVRLRFGGAALHFYVWSMMAFRMIGVGVSLYALSVIVVALMPLAEGNPLRDAMTGNLSIYWAVLVFGAVIIVYTMLGGLWAVLMTDVVQFIVLNLAVLFVIPLSLMQVDYGSFSQRLPENFFSPVSGGYTWFFLAGWLAIHFFMIGAEWAFVQRFICVPTTKDARKGAYLFGALYLVSPLLWLLPPLLWRVRNPLPADATPEQIQIIAEQAYILSCQSVLPAGMIGLLLAAMFSATASTVSGQLNVFAGVLTNDVYRRILGSRVTEPRLVWFGRFATGLLGCAVLAIALSVPRFGGAENIAITINSLMVVPLLAPSLCGLVNSRVSTRAVWITAGVGLPIAIALKFGFAANGPFAAVPALAGITQWITANERTFDIGLGVILPLALLAIAQLSSRGVAIGWKRLHALESPTAATPSSKSEAAEHSSGSVVGWSLAACGAITAILIPFNSEGRITLGIFSVGLWMLAIGMVRWSRRSLLVKVVPVSQSIESSTC